MKKQNLIYRFGLFVLLSLNLNAKGLDLNLPEATFEQHQSTTEIKTKTGSFILKNPILNNDANKDKFLETRKMVLTRLATALQTLSYGMGSIEWINEKWAFQKIKRQSISIQELAQSAPSEIRADILGASQSQLDEALAELEKRTNRTLKEKAYDLTLAILMRTDQMLINQKEVVAQANEFGFMASLGPQFIVGSQNKGLGGMLSVGFALGYNKKSGAFFLDIFQSIEKFESTLMKLAFSAGLILKSGVLVRATADQDHSLQQSQTFYPPAVPGFANWSKSSFASGLSSGLTIPPSPIGDLMTYQTQTSSESMVRIEISKVYPLWVRVKSPLLTSKIQLIKEKLGWGLNNITNPCEKVLN